MRVPIAVIDHGLLLECLLGHGEGEVNDTGRVRGGGEGGGYAK